MKKLILFLVLSSTLFCLDLTGIWESEPDREDHAMVFYNTLEIERKEVLLLTRAEPKKSGEIIIRRVQGRIIPGEFILFEKRWNPIEKEWADFGDEKWSLNIENVEEDSFILVEKETGEELVFRRGSKF